MSLKVQSTPYAEKKRALPYNRDLNKKHWHSQFVNVLYIQYVSITLGAFVPAVLL